MAQVIPSQQVVVKEIITKENEVTVNLVLTIKLETSNSANEFVPQKQVIDDNLTLNKESDNYYTPDIKNEPLINFGKKVE
jgi:hypothetical protein